MGSDLYFSIPEILSIMGLVQCVYVLVYMALRSGNIHNSIIPCFYFLFMGLAFFFDFAGTRWSDGFHNFEIIQWMFWFSSVPLGVLLALQIAKIRDRLNYKYFWLLLVLPMTFLPGYYGENIYLSYILGLILGCICLLVIWARRDVFEGLHAHNIYGEERFWLVIALIVLNVVFLGVTWAHLNNWIMLHDWIPIRNILGIAFVYIAGTSLFRIYPQVLRKTSQNTQDLNAADLKIFERLKHLMEVEKIYQDSSFGRAELARDLGVGESHLSRIVNHSYGKTIPQLLNEWRVRDAQRLLSETDVNIQIVFEESGFNSITTFNRVFKDIVGETPSDYRVKKHKTG